MSHVDEGTLHAYLDGELPSSERERAAVHVAECAECRARLEETRALIARAKEVLALSDPPERERPALVPSERGRRSGWPTMRMPLAWVATLALGIGIGWYLQGERVNQELADRTVTPTAKAPAAEQTRPRARAAPLSPTPPAPLAASPTRRAESESESESESERKANQIATASEPSRDEADAWTPIDADSARLVLGRSAALLPAYPVRRMARSPDADGVVLIEQELPRGTIIRLYEQQTSSVEEQPARGVALPSRRARVDAQVPSAAPTALAPTASGALNARDARRSERLARYIGSLRVEIAGPLPADSLTKLLEKVRP